MNLFFMEHILDLDSQVEELEDLFAKIRQSNTILFLGAGASVGEKKYLSKQLIEYYESKLGYSLNETNITRWIDILSANEKFSRSDFDNFVVSILQKLQITEAHKIMAGVPWREIITTNYDLLVERAYDTINTTSSKIYDLKPIRSLKQLNYKESNNEIRFIKLNGCISDKSLYPLAFSTDDFENRKRLYKIVLNELKNLSPEISLLSMGYSFSDDFGREMLEKFDSYQFRDRRWIFNVDPFPNENALSFYTKNRICIVKCSFEDFFKRYREWDTKQANIIINRKGLKIFDSKEFSISSSPTLLLNLDGIVRQLNSKSRGQYIKDEDFYRGEEPTFDIISRGVDVIKKDFVNKFSKIIEDTINQPKGTFLPVFFIEGDFGIGKSTFTLRLIYELEKRSDLDLVCFEILDVNRVKKEFLIDLVNTCKVKNLVFYIDEVEVESHFKGFLEIQRDLSIEQFQDCNIMFIIPIRENMLEKFKLHRQVPNSIELILSGKFQMDEINELLEKLKTTGLVNYRDAAEKKSLAEKVVKDFDADSFISMMSFVTSGNHENDLISSYNQLSTDAKKAFLFTALLHRCKLLMPASWLKQNISMNWDEFISKIVKAEGKGILIQVLKTSHGVQPDLFFRTKHPLIAEKLISRFVPSIDKRMGYYEQMLARIDVGSSNSFLVNDLLKALSRSEEYSSVQIDKLFDIAYTRLSDDPYFLLNYANNLQYRKTKSSLKKAIDHLIYAESLLEYRNHKFIHRRAVINFELAKLYFAEEEELNYTEIYLSEAEELFITKQLLDPFSAFSYVDYIKMLLWQLQNINHDDEDELQKHILIEDLLDLAFRTVTDNINKINYLHSSYTEYLGTIIRDVDYKLHLDSLYEDSRLRPYACILLYNYYSTHGDLDACNGLIKELEGYQENIEVVKFLFKVYGRQLYDTNIRIDLLRIGRRNSITLEKDNHLRYNFFHFIAESYNHNYGEGKNYLAAIKSKYNNLNPEFHYEWREQDGSVRIFDAKVIKNSNEKFKGIKIPEIQLTAKLIKGNYDNYKVGTEVRVKLHFYLYGLMAEILENDVDNVIVASLKNHY